MLPYVASLNGWPRNPLAPEGTALYNEATTMMLVGVVFPSDAGVVGEQARRKNRAI